MPRRVTSYSDFIRHVSDPTAHGTEICTVPLWVLRYRSGLYRVAQLHARTWQKIMLHALAEPVFCHVAKFPVPKFLPCSTRTRVVYSRIYMLCGSYWPWHRRFAALWPIRVKVPPGTYRGTYLYFVYEATFY